MSASISQVLLKHLEGTVDAQELTSVVSDISRAVTQIKHIISDGKLGDHHGLVGGTNVQGEDQKKLDVISDEIFLEHIQKSGHVAGIVTEEQEDEIAFKKDGKFLLAFDPLDGSSNIEINMSIGSIFSIYRHDGSDITKDTFLKPGKEQIASGYSVFGASTNLILTFNKGILVFALDKDDNYVLIQEGLHISKDTKEYGINDSNERFWHKPVQEYVKDCKLGTEGPRGKDFNMRWVGAMVAEAYRIMERGGVYLYPKDKKEPIKEGRLRLLYEANPIALIMKDAGGYASTGEEDILEIVPTEIHQRISLIFGSHNEVKTIEEYYKKFS